MVVYICVCVCVFSSAVSDSATPWTVAFQAPLSMEFSRQEYWSGMSFPTPGGLPYPGIKPMSLTFLALAGKLFTPSTTWEALREEEEAKKLPELNPPPRVLRSSLKDFKKAESCHSSPCPHLPIEPTCLLQLSPILSSGRQGTPQRSP